jgi:hypothetical protein
VNVYARAGLGGVAGAVATYVLDVVGTLIYTERIAQREKEIQKKSAAYLMAEKFLRRLDLEPTDADIKRAAPILHWLFGITSGMIAGALATRTGVRSSLVVAGGMFAFDEVGLSLVGAAAPSTRYPWQTNLRSLVGHATYGASLAIAFETLRALVTRCSCE